MKNMNEKSKMEDVYLNYLKEKSELEELIFECRREFEKLEEKILFDKDSYNKLRIFSPRQNMRLEEDVIKESKERSNELIERMNSYKRKLSEIENNIKAIEQIREKIKAQPGVEILSMNENDRKRIARDLHDSTIQSMVYLIHKIEYASKFVDQDPVRAKLELSIVTKSLKDVIQEMRDLVYDLHPMNFDDLGFETTLLNFFDNVSHTSSMKISYEIHMQYEQYNQLILITLFRIIQECCNNAIKHSKGKKLLVFLKEDKGFLILKVQDDGIGFSQADLEDKDVKHFGLKIMKERVSFLSGNFFINSTEEGTVIQIKIPIEND